MPDSAPTFASVSPPDPVPGRCARCFPRGVLAAWIVAAAVILILGIRNGSNAHHRAHSVIGTYLGAGRNWLAGNALYISKGSAGFVYSPLVAALFAPFTVLPEAASHPLWLALSMAAFLWAVWAGLRAGLFPSVGKEAYAAVFLLLLPLSLGNFNNGQVNPLVIALLLFAVVAVKGGRMTLAALCVAAAVYFKIYPIAMGLVLMVAYPKDFSWRFLLALLALGALSFVLQRPPYVLSQYQLWFATRMADTRHEEGIVRDLFIVFKALHIDVSERAHMAFQALSGAAIAALAVAGRFRFHWSSVRLLVAVFCLVDAWMLLCGPATESATYVMLAPAVAAAVVESFRKPLPAWLKGLACASLVILLLGTAINSFLQLEKTPLVMSVQPLGALVFACFALVWICSDRFWSEPEGAAER